MLSTDNDHTGDPKIIHNFVKNFAGQIFDGMYLFGWNLAAVDSGNRLLCNVHTFIQQN